MKTKTIWTLPSLLLLSTPPRGNTTITTPNRNQKPTPPTSTSTPNQSPQQHNPSNRFMSIGRAGLALIMLVIIGAVTGCGESLPSPNSALDLVPEDADAVFRLDLPAIAEDPDLLENAHEISGDWLIYVDWEAEEATIGNLEVDLALVEEVFYLIDDTDIILLRGDLQFEDLREDLEDANYEETPYRGYEAWASPQWNFALLEDDGYLIYSPSMSAVEGILKNLYRGDGSLAADEDAELKRILNKMGDAPAVMAMAGEHCPDNRCQGLGVAFTGTDSQGEKLTADFVVLYSSERAAEQAADDYDTIADFLLFILGLDVDDTTSEGEFVVGEATYGITGASSGSQMAPSQRNPTAQAQFPQGQPIREVQIPVEVIKEVIVEVPVEVIKEVIVEVPVEVIKEVEVPVEVIKQVEVEVPVEVEVIKQVEVEVGKECN